MARTRQTTKNDGLSHPSVTEFRLNLNSATSGVRIFDVEHSEEEERWITLGLDRAGALLVVCHTFREVKESGRASTKIRLISARRADRREAAQYRGPKP
ncbi:MAG: BrnT family toxin [Bryobacteraceae bacterium]